MRLTAWLCVGKHGKLRDVGGVRVLSREWKVEFFFTACKKGSVCRKRKINIKLSINLM